MDTSWVVGALVAVMMLVGLTGIIVPVLPGLALVWAGTLVWALAEQSASGWTVLAVATVLWLGGMALQWLLPGKRLKRAGLSNRTMLVAGLFGLVGFFLIPVVGLFVGFPLGVYVMESLEARRTRDGRSPLALTGQALRAAGLSIVIELLTGLLITGMWAASLLGDRWLW